MKYFCPKNKMNIALFASGSGSNVKNIIDYFDQDLEVNVKLVISNKSAAGALIHAENSGIETKVFSYLEINSISPVIEIFNEYDIELVVLAGFLLKIPAELIKEFNGEIINLHPSLLPKYGGKGMYGNNVHKAVLEAGESHTGITIHYVNEQYDKGKIIAQFSTAISDNETTETLLGKIKTLEKDHFPATINKVIKQKSL